MRTVREILEGSVGKFSALRSLVGDADNSAWALGRKFSSSSEDFGFSADDMETAQYKKFKKLVETMAATANKLREAFNDLAEIAKGQEEP